MLAGNDGGCEPRGLEGVRWGKAAEVNLYLPEDFQHSLQIFRCPEAFKKYCPPFPPPHGSMCRVRQSLSLSSCSAPGKLSGGGRGLPWTPYKAFVKAALFMPLSAPCQELWSGHLPLRCFILASPPTPGGFCSGMAGFPKVSQPRLWLTLPFAV